ncbi:helix-turn-helix domain-containing protein [Alcanivorax sp. DP30]|uniref:winged helix-turn-helix transcriptional regulator n=1 Tax=Alcanivorax sp. DP30 TaxID=2606217 RepID=UPI00136E3201|nr:helix-turn-helix domain-containing protein [Alcanivorax sp. DP30]MZR64390.1 transcriptional regulator [Alcanivorax sp. DP30]
MKWHQLGDMNCPVGRSLSILGDRWTLLIIRNAFLRTHRFEDFQKQLGMTRHLLADRLNRLVEKEVLKKVLYQDGPKRYEYRLTDAGQALYPVILMLGKWGNNWLNDGADHPPLEFIHNPCGHKTDPQLRCSECGEELHARDMQPLLVEGAGQEGMLQNTGDSHHPGQQRTASRG